MGRELAIAWKENVQSRSIRLLGGLAFIERCPTVEGLEKEETRRTYALHAHARTHTCTHTHTHTQRSSPFIYQ